MRIRFKAAVHSGSLNDSLNDCDSGYCVWFEEHHWQRDLLHDDDRARKECDRIVRSHRAIASCHRIV